MDAFELVNGPEGLALVLRGPWRPELREVIRNADVRHLRLSANLGFREDRVDFLSWLPHLERLDLIGATVRDLTPLYRLPGLRALTLNGRLGRLDLTAFPHLERLRISWSARNFPSLLEARPLRVLALAGYSAADLSAFQHLTNLGHLALMDARIRNVDGVGALPALVDLQLDGMPRLESLHGLAQADHLRALRIRRAARLADLGDIAHAESLEYLRLVDCPAMNSAAPLAANAALRSVALEGRTRLREEDLRALRARSDLLSLCTDQSAPGPAATPYRPAQARALLRAIAAEPAVR